MAFSGTVVGKAPVGKSPIYRNNRPNDPVYLENASRELVQDKNGRYWLKSATGKLLTPNGRYDFVNMPDGKTYVVRPNTNPDYSTHLGLTKGKDVKYAGEIRFYDNQGNSRGNIKEWSNRSGHYLPSANNVEHVDLPIGKFNPWVK